MLERLRSFFYLVPELWRAFSRRKEASRARSDNIQISPYFRGKPELDPELCRGCGVCVRDCPAYALELEREDRERFRLVLYQDRCAYCGQCEASCDFEAIKLGNKIAVGAAEREDFVEVLVDHLDDSS
jgi:hydrogenase-4 component H